MCVCKCWDLTAFIAKETLAETMTIFQIQLINANHYFENAIFKQTTINIFSTFLSFHGSSFQYNTKRSPLNNECSTQWEPKVNKTNWTTKDRNLYQSTTINRNGLRCFKHSGYPETASFLHGCVQNQRDIYAHDSQIFFIQLAVLPMIYNRQFCELKIDLIRN